MNKTRYSSLLICLIAIISLETRVFCQPIPLQGKSKSSDIRKTLTVDAILRSTRALSSGKSAQGTLKAHFLDISKPLPGQVFVTATSSHYLECEASGRPTPKIIWLKNGKPIEKIESRKSINENLFDVVKPTTNIAIVKSRLYFDCMTPEDEAIYTCVAMTPYDRVESETILKVVLPGTNGGHGTGEEEEEEMEEDVLDSIDRNGKIGCLARNSISFNQQPKIVYWIETILEITGSTIKLPCKAIGQPEVRIKWTKPDESSVKNDFKFKINKNGDLIIRNISFDDMGSYTCSAENENGIDSQTTFVYPAKPDNENS